MRVTLVELANSVGGEVRGEVQTVICGFTPLEHAQQGALTFVAAEKYRPHLAASHASAVLAGGAGWGGRQWADWRQGPY